MICLLIIYIFIEGGVDMMLNPRADPTELRGKMNRKKIEEIVFLDMLKPGNMF